MLYLMFYIFRSKFSLGVYMQTIMVELHVLRNYVVNVLREWLYLGRTMSKN